MTTKKEHAEEQNCQDDRGDDYILAISLKSKGKNGNENAHYRRRNKEEESKRNDSLRAKDKQPLTYLSERFWKVEQSVDRQTSWLGRQQK